MLTGGHSAPPKPMKGEYHGKRKIKELAKFFGCDAEDITVSNWNNRIFEIGNREYLVLTDEEAEEETTGQN